MVNFKCFVSILLLTLNSEVYCDCSLALDKDFGSPYPVLLQKDDFLNTNSKTGDIIVRGQEVVTVACPGKYVVLGNSTTDLDVVQASCLRGNTFRMDWWTGSFQDIRCSELPRFSAEFTNRKCSGGNAVIRVGYEVQKKFYQLYEICFDRGLLTAVYSKHTLEPASQFIQHNPRPNFIDTNIFGKVPVSQLYKVSYQKTRLDDLLGNGMGAEYITAKQSMNRGHLAPRADFCMSYNQRPTFHYANVAPQWKRGNAGDWAALEEGLRRRVKAYGSAVTVYTGTHSVLTLEDSSGNPEEIYLYTDQNNNYVVPVPLYYYKLVYDPKKKTAAAFVSINSSYYNKTAIESLTFCVDDCTRHSWLTWRNDGTYSFCCTYEELKSGIESVPELAVTGYFS